MKQKTTTNRTLKRRRRMNVFFFLWFCACSQPLVHIHYSDSQNSSSFHSSLGMYEVWFWPRICFYSLALLQCRFNGCFLSLILLCCGRTLSSLSAISAPRHRFSVSFYIRRWTTLPRFRLSSISPSSPSAVFVLDAVTHTTDNESHFYYASVLFLVSFFLFHLDSVHPFSRKRKIFILI